MKKMRKLLLVLAALLVLALSGCGQTDQQTQPVAEELPQESSERYAVITTSPIRSGAAGYEIDVFAMGSGQTMTLTIDESGLMPRVGRSYGVKVKNGAVGLFCVPDTTSGTYAADFTPKAISSRDGKYFYDGSGNKFAITDETVIYYVDVKDNGIHLSQADTLTSFAQWNGNCKGDNEPKTHVHTSACRLYNAYISYRSGFVGDATLAWVMISTDGQSLYTFMGKETDSQYACLPGQNPGAADIVVTTSEPYTADGVRQVEVQNLLGETYTARLSDESLYPTGGRLYRIKDNGSGAYTLSAPTEDGDGYDFRNGAVTDLSDTQVVINTEKTIELTSQTRIVEAKRLWTGWLALTDTEGSVLGSGKATKACTEQGSHTHTRKCYYYNTVYNAHVR